jgi:antitoxin HigA-1
MPRIRSHPGQILKDEFMSPLELSASRLAIELGVPATRIGNIIRADNPRAVTADTALRLARYFETTAGFWMNLQAAYDLSKTEAEKGREIASRVRPRTRS